MNTTDFDYHLPPEQIAQKSIEPRDHAKLMLIDRKDKTRSHTQFFNIIDSLQKGDLLVWNNSKVFKARLFGKLVSADGEVLRDHEKKVEIFLVRPMENPGVWKALAKPGKHVRIGTKVVFADDFYCEPMVKEPDGTLLVQFPYNEATVRRKANQYGQVPLPPYVKDEKHELESYQNTYAKVEGSVAAPTSGFHFTSEVIKNIKAKGVDIADVTLHVGLGTFLPVKTEKVEDHTMHAEWVELSKETVDKIEKAKQDGRRVIAVGTTTVRTLEGIAAHLGGLHPYEGDINIFITPGFQFQVVDALITNFHLPKSTLLMLVSAFVGDTPFVLQSYKDAVENNYRFYSFGDAMFIS